MALILHLFTTLHAPVTVIKITGLDRIEVIDLELNDDATDLELCSEATNPFVMFSTVEYSITFACLAEHCIRPVVT